MDHLVGRACLVVQGLLHTVIEDMHVEGNAQDVLVTLGIAASFPPRDMEPLHLAMT